MPDSTRQITVAELIKMLVKCDQTAIVTVDDSARGNFPVSEPEPDTNPKTGQKMIVLHCQNTEWGL